MAVPMTPLVGLVAFSAWWSAALFLAGATAVSVFAVRHNEKHYRSERFDDRLSTERMEKARDWLLEN